MKISWKLEAKVVRNAKYTKDNSIAKSDKSPKLNERTTYMSLNASRGRILNEIMNVKLKDVGLDVPKPLRTRNGGGDQSKILLLSPHNGA